MHLSHFKVELLVAVFLAVLCLNLRAEAKPPATGNNPDDDAVWLHVKGTQIVTSSASGCGEKPFIPVGIGYCRDVIIRAQDDEVMKFCKERSLNTVRLSFYLQNFNNSKDRPIDVAAHLRDFVDPVVAAARKNKMYIILDDHEYFSTKIDEKNARGKQKSELWDEAGIQSWINGWVQVAEKYRNEPYVLGYELLNEPHGRAPGDVREKYTRCLQVIRRMDARHIILLGNNDWDHSRAMENTWGPAASTVDAPLNNVVFAFHDYPEDDDPLKVQNNITKFRDTHHVPVICTEFGATRWSKSETVCREFQTGMLALFAKENVGWMIWALVKLEDMPRNSYNVVDKVGMRPPPAMDSCAYSDLWKPVSRIMGSPFPTDHAVQMGK